MTNGRSNGRRSLATSVSRKNGSVIPATAAGAEVPVEQRALGPARDGGRGHAGVARGGGKRVRERRVHIGPSGSVRGVVQGVDARHGRIGERPRGRPASRPRHRTSACLRAEAAGSSIPRARGTRGRARPAAAAVRRPAAARAAARPDGTDAARATASTTSHTAPSASSTSINANGRAIRQRGEGALETRVHARRIHTLDGRRGNRHARPRARRPPAVRWSRLSGVSPPDAVLHTHVKSRELALRMTSTDHDYNIQHLNDL